MAVLMVEKKDESMGSIRAVWKVESKACYWAYAPVALMVKWMVVKMAASRAELSDWKRKECLLVAWLGHLKDVMSVRG